MAISFKEAAEKGWLPDHSAALWLADYIAYHERMRPMARDNNSATEAPEAPSIPENAIGQAPMYDSSDNALQALRSHLGLGMAQAVPFTPPLNMELPLSQVSTGKTARDGRPTSKLKSWVTADLARYVERVKAQGASRVHISVQAIYE